MTTAIKALEQIKKGHCSILWGRICLRVGDKFIVGETINIRATPITIEEAAAILAIPV
jgi:hypothetical protein